MCSGKDGFYWSRLLQQRDDHGAREHQYASDRSRGTDAFVQPDGRDGQTEEGDEVVGERGLDGVDGFERLKEEDHCERGVEEHEHRQAGPRCEREVGQAEKAVSLERQDKGGHQRGETDVGPEQHLHRGMPIECSLTVGVVERTAEDSGKDQQVPEQLTLVELDTVDVETGAECDPGKCQGETDPAQAGHLLFEKEYGKDGCGYGERERQDGGVGCQRHARAPRHEELAGDYAEDAQHGIDDEEIGALLAYDPWTDTFVLFALHVDEGIQDREGERGRKPHGEERASLVLHEFDTGELQRPHQVAGEQKGPGDEFGLRGASGRSRHEVACTFLPGGASHR